MIVTILIILTKLFTWMLFGFPQSERELDYEGRGVDSRQGQAHVLNLQSGSGAHQTSGH